MLNLNYPDSIIALSIMLLAYGFRGITGFGSGLIAIPLLALIYPLTFVVPFITLLDWLASVLHGVHHRKQAQWSLIVPALPFTLAGIITALYVFKNIDTIQLVRALAIFILGFSIYSLISPDFKPHNSKLWAAPAGLFGGIVSTLFGTGGPFYVMYLQFQGIPKGIFRATIASIFVIEGILRVTGYTIVGFYTKDMLILVLVSIPVMVLAMSIGGHIHTNISQRSFQRAVGILLLGSGIALLYK
ncbi:MAG: sulfite exporter TauE/SafE family protein [Gammaproteobacteria bacterium]